MARVRAGERVEVVDGARRDELDGSPQLQVAAGVVGVHDEEARPGVADEVAALEALEGGVDARDAVAVDVRPDEAGARRAVGPERRQDRRDGALEQVAVRGGDGPRRDAARRHGAGPSDGVSQSSATTRLGRIRHRTGVSVAASSAGTHSPK